MPEMPATTASDETAGGFSVRAVACYVVGLSMAWFPGSKPA